MNDSHEANFDRLGKFVAAMMEKTGLPGVAVGVLHEGETCTAGFGVTNVDHPLPVTDETLCFLCRFAPQKAGLRRKTTVFGGFLPSTNPERIYASLYYAQAPLPRHILSGQLNISEFSWPGTGN